jgi:hypothetical protein
VFQESRGRLLEYEGASRGDDEVAVPLAVANNFGHAFTGIQAQNAGTAETQVTVRYGPNTATRTAPGASKLCPDPGDSRPQTVAPGASATFLQRADGDARFADCTYVGSATVTSSNGQPLIVVGNQLGDDGGSSFLGTPVSALDRAVDMPLVQANNYGSISGIQVQNVGDGPGRLNITFGPNTATVRPGRPDPCPAPPRTVDERLEARASRTLVLPADDPTVAGCTYIGTARATIRTLDPNAGAPLLVGLVNQVIPGLDDNLSTYEAL